MLRIFLLSFFMLFVGCHNLDWQKIDSPETAKTEMFNKQPIEESKRNPDESKIASLEDHSQTTTLLEKDNEIKEAAIGNLNKELPQVEKCYRELIEKELNPPQGKILVSLEISENGVLTELTLIEDNLQRSTLLDCVSKILKGIEFDKSTRILRVKYEFLFIINSEKSILI